MKTNKHRWNNIAAYLAGEMNDSQSEEFLSMVNDDKLLKNDFEEMKKNWKHFDAHPAEKYINSEAAWNKLHDKIDQDGLLEQDIIPIRNTKYLLRVAAVIALILSISIPSVFYSLKNNNTSGSVVEHQSSEGVLTVDLPDGSRVFLNKGAKLEYSKSFEEKRQVTLDGEGFFNVMSDPKRPFRVNSGKVMITVLGTSFNVRESENKNIEVFVETGEVKVNMEKKSDYVILHPGEIGSVDKEIHTASQTNPNYLAWKTKEFKFVDEQVNLIINTLSEAYHVEVQTKGLPLQDLRLTTTYKDQSFDAILSTICLAHDLSYEKKRKVYILHSN